MRLAPHDVVELAEVAHVVGEGSGVERCETPIPVGRSLNRLVELRTRSSARSLVTFPSSSNRMQWHAAASL